jgi:integrase
MAENRTVEDILGDMAPIKSSAAYKKAWDSLVDYLEHDNKPSEEDMIRYFDNLHTVKGLAASTCWTNYSMLNDHFKRVYGEQLQQYTRLTMLLKRYNEGYHRKTAEVFTLEQIQTFLQGNFKGHSSYWKLRKAYAAICFVGGLRTTEMKKLSMDSFELGNEGYIFSYIPAKQRNGAQRTKKFLVPFNNENPANCWASQIRSYLDNLEQDLGSDKGSGELFKTVLKSGKFSKCPMGYNYLGKIPKDVAEVLELDNPKSFTGHSFRRSSATHAADEGASSVEMRRYYNWKDDTIANKYIEETLSGNRHMAQIMTTRKSTDQTNSSAKSSAPESVTSATAHGSGESARIAVDRALSHHNYAVSNTQITSPTTEVQGQRTYNIVVQAGAVMNLY